MLAAQQPNMFVVRTSQRIRPGETATTFGLWCMGSRGEVAEASFGTAFVYATLLHTAIVAAVAAALWGATRLRRGRQAVPIAPATPTGPLSARNRTADLVRKFGGRSPRTGRKLP